MGLLRKKRPQQPTLQDPQNGIQTTNQQSEPREEANQIPSISPSNDSTVVSQYKISPVLTVELNKILGRGGYGEVFEGTYLEEKVAIKRISLINKYENEENALKNLKHPNVIQLLHIESDDHSRYYVLERCQASLDKRFLNQTNPNRYNGPMPNEIDVLLQLAKGLEYIHTSKMIHRDIKPLNVLIWINPENNTVLMKWADFGLSKSVNENGSCSMSGINKGTIYWFAPEILKIQQDEEESETTTLRKRATVKSDVYSEGLVFGYYLLGGRHPFGKSFEIPFNILNNNPVTLNEITERQPIHDIIMEMLNSDPAKRISSADVVSRISSLE